jgi:hypothetical protein
MVSTLTIILKQTLSGFFIDETLLGLKKFATLLPKNWLAETPQALAEEAWQTVGGKGTDF